jgi:hypothetical protein
MRIIEIKEEKTCNYTLIVGTYLLCKYEDYSMHLSLMNQLDVI